MERGHNSEVPGVQIFIGVDGGGTRTRAVAVDSSGRVVSRADSGGSSPEHTPDAQRNALEAIRLVIERAERSPRNVAYVVAGFAGLDDPSDKDWAHEQTNVDGLICPRMEVNDAVVAHAGALCSRPGIIAIAGTGSIVFGVTETGHQVRNYDFRNYASAAAPNLAHNAVHRVLAGDAEDADREFVDRILEHWNVKTIDELRVVGSNGFMPDRVARYYHFGAMGRIVTESAEQGAPLARSVCDHGAQTMGVGIRLVGGSFADRIVNVAFIGSAIESSYMTLAVTEALAKDKERAFIVSQPAFAPEIGAAMMALERGGIALIQSVLENLRDEASQ